MLKSLSYLLVFIFIIWNIYLLFKIEKEHFYHLRNHKKSYLKAEFVAPFAFLCSYALYLPISIVPLYMKYVAQGFLGLSDSFLMSLPITIDMGSIGVASILTVIFVSSLKGFKKVVLIGLICGITGMFLTSLATNGYILVLARIIYGFGYCGFMMGVQFYVLKTSQITKRTKNFSLIYSGVFSGILCGSATGGVIASSLGYRAVFLTAAVMLLAIFSYFIYMLKSRENTDNLDSDTYISHRFSLKALVFYLKNVKILSIYILQIISYGAVAVGFYNYYIPITLTKNNIGADTIGAILMIYSLVVIFASRLCGFLMDKIKHKYLNLVVASLLLSTVPLCFYLNNIVIAALFACIILGLISALNEGGQMSYLATFKESQEFGLNESIALVDVFMRVGQMIGPMMVAFFMTNYENAYLSAIFLLFFIICIIFYVIQKRL